MYYTYQLMVAGLKKSMPVCITSTAQTLDRCMLDNRLRITEE